MEDNGLGVFGRVLQGAKAGYSVGGGWGALIGGVAGAGMAVYESSIVKKPYTVTNYTNNNTSMSGFIEGMPGIERKTKLIPRTTVSAKAQQAQDIATGFDTITGLASIASSLKSNPESSGKAWNGGPENFDYNFTAEAKRKYNMDLQKIITQKPLIQTQVKPMNARFQNYVPGAENLTNTLNRNDIEDEWSQTMKDMKDNFPNLFNT